MDGRIRTLMYDKKIKQKDLAKLLGRTRKSISMKMSGKSPFLYSEVLEICKLLEIENPLHYKWS